MSAYSMLQETLRSYPRTWLVTGAAGFIGSHLVETLLRLDQRVVGFDNFATGHQRNLDDVLRLVPEGAGRFRLETGDLADPAACARAALGADYVLHQGGLGSVPRSIDNPQASHESNVTGTLNLLVAARDAGVKRFVYASSSSVYGDEPNLPKTEARIGKPLSPYAATKRMLEIYAGVFHHNYGLGTTGLRYFNVFGSRQDPNGPYAAVIPRWVAALRAGEPIFINGDGSTSRDFCYVANVVQANLLAATSTNPDAAGEAFNVAVGQRTDLNTLFRRIRDGLSAYDPSVATAEPVYRDFRAGDVAHSLADISKAQNLLGYAPTHSLEEGLAVALQWYFDNL
jgi:UDP-N-acetylglucosamine/UDP-N-acetylgalactosamine 4-epimerase